MFEKIKDALSVFRYGNEIANPQAWKTFQITGTVVGGFILACINLAKDFGYPFPIDSDSANALSVAIVSIASVLITAATSKRAGILPSIRPDGHGDIQGNAGVPHPGISQATRDAALRSVGQASDPLEGLDTTYSP